MLDVVTLGSDRTPSPTRRLIATKLGEVPEMSLQAMMGYGLSEKDIARYFDVTPSSIRRLCRAFGLPETSAA